MTTAKNLYIISGCNGAGKTTASFSILPEILECNEFVNADEIAKGLSPFNPESVALEAGKLMLQRIAVLLEQRETFSIETTLATRSYAQLIKKAQSLGYRVYLLYFWLNSTELAIDRVRQRVQEGGHNIPTETIVRRYHAGIQNLFDIFIPIVDDWIIINNSEVPRTIIAHGGKGTISKIHDSNLFNIIRNDRERENQL